MKVKDYIIQRFQTFGINLSEADLCDMCQGIDGEGEVNDAVLGKVKVSIAKFIPALLLRATSINESGFSMSWNIEGVKDYYSYLCKQYGLKDELNQKPKVTFL